VDHPFAAGQIVTVFRSRLRGDADAAPGYHDEADELLALARAVPGFVDHKVFRADDGERVALVTFADRAAHDAWRDDPRHRAAQQRGRDGWYDGYSIQVGTCTAAHGWERDG
jgi:heme-degrading monooxygenase HmoA